MSGRNAGVTLPRVRWAEATTRLPTPQEVAAVLVAVAAPVTRVLVLLAAGAGLRLGELGGLQVAEVDLLRRTIRVRRQLTRATGGCFVESPPKYGRELDVPEPDALLEEVAVYSHLWPSSDDRMRSALAGLLVDLASAAPRTQDPADSCERPATHEDR